MEGGSPVRDCADQGRALRTPALEAEKLSKAFGAVQAVAEVSFSMYAGEILGLIGDNGAGKSTLVKCLSGVLTPDSGRIRIEGEEVALDSPREARKRGVETVFQDLALVETLDVVANLFLNREELRALSIGRWTGWLDRPRMRRDGRQILDKLAIRIPSITQGVSRLSGGQRQAVAIGRAIAWGRRVVLLDEPAAALGVEQSKHVLELMRTLTQHGVAVLLISHNMQHVIEACDRAVVLRHGRKVGDVAVRDVTARDLVDLITGARGTMPLHLP